MITPGTAQSKREPAHYRLAVTSEFPRGLKAAQRDKIDVIRRIV
jgi:hypothetical protein